MLMIELNKVLSVLLSTLQIKVAFSSQPKVINYRNNDNDVLIFPAAKNTI